jgi:HD-GYP domain-containing protein (c-di-GMP phosphodiesterase class II)
MNTSLNQRSSTAGRRNFLRMEHPLLNEIRYTGGHSLPRVRVLTGMLAAHACASNQLPFAGFDLNPDEWEELHVASWLHDCGKLTTPIRGQQGNQTGDGL